MAITAYTTTAHNLTNETIQTYRHQGFVHIPGIISREEAEQYRLAALDVERRLKSPSQRKVFTQLVNVWREDETMRQLTLHPNVGAVAERLAGVPLRIWHDQVLIKQPHNNVSTELHQDQPFWPHANSFHSLSAWIALVDVPVDRGCMTFITGSQSKTNLSAQNLGDPNDLLQKSPDLQWDQRITIPLKAGDCTFHHSRTAHMATPNLTDDPRVAHVVIYMDASTTYTGIRHVVTDPLNLQVGQLLTGDYFPSVEEISAHQAK